MADRKRVLVVDDDAVIRTQIGWALTGEYDVRAAATAADALFRPFRTTKDAGLGLGLYQCRAVVQGYGGRICASNGERGAVFEVALPAA